jgi:hypothetical protein
MQGPPQAYQTYAVLAPHETHWRPATCEEADCSAYLFGWRTVVDLSTDLGQKQYHYITRLSGRKFVEEPGQADNTAVFTFEPGQKCFRSDDHRVRTGRPELYLVREGDGRELGGLIRRHTRSEDWLDDFGSHQLALQDRLERG